MDALTTTQSTAARQYIVIKLGSEQYGVNINYIDNIVRMQRITRVPKAQSYFKGVINLRGEIVPVMSLRLKFGLPADEITDKTRIRIWQDTSAQSERIRESLYHFLISSLRLQIRIHLRKINSLSERRCHGREHT